MEVGDTTTEIGETHITIAIVVVTGEATTKVVIKIGIGRAIAKIVIMVTIVITINLTIKRTADTSSRTSKKDTRLRICKENRKISSPLIPPARKGSIPTLIYKNKQIETPATLITRPISNSPLSTFSPTSLYPLNLI